MMNWIQTLWLMSLRGVAVIAVEFSAKGHLFESSSSDNTCHVHLLSIEAWLMYVPAVWTWSIKSRMWLCVTCRVHGRDVFRTVSSGLPDESVDALDVVSDRRPVWQRLPDALALRHRTKSWRWSRLSSSDRRWSESVSVTVVVVNQTRQRWY